MKTFSFLVFTTGPLPLRLMVEVFTLETARLPGIPVYTSTSIDEKSIMYMVCTSLAGLTHLGVRESGNCGQNFVTAASFYAAQNPPLIFSN